jgi:hypothetical protein
MPSAAPGDGVTCICTTCCVFVMTNYMDKLHGQTTWTNYMDKLHAAIGMNMSCNTSCHPKNEPFIATREVGADPLQTNGVSTNSCLRQHLPEIQQNVTRRVSNSNRIACLNTRHVAPSPIGESSHSNSSLKRRVGDASTDGKTLISSINY